MTTPTRLLKYPSLPLWKNFSTNQWFIQRHCPFCLKLVPLPHQRTITSHKCWLTNVTLQWKTNDKYFKRPMEFSNRSLHTQMSEAWDYRCTCTTFFTPSIFFSTFFKNNLTWKWQPHTHITWLISFHSLALALLFQTAPLHSQWHWLQL